MNDIHDATTDFKFENLSMTSPASSSGGAHFSKYLMNRNPLYIQTPKCSTKMGVVKSGKKIHMDLVFTNENEEFIQWIETLETTTRKLIYANRAKWFDMELDEDDIESYFTPTVKLFKSGKQYLVRVNINQRVNGTPAVKIYDETEVDVAPETLDDKSTMITIIEVQGVRCSAKSFQIELVLKQVMVLKPVEIFDKCIIKTRASVALAPNIQMNIVEPIVVPVEVPEEPLVVLVKEEDSNEEDPDEKESIATEEDPNEKESIATEEDPNEKESYVINLPVSETLITDSDILEVDLEDANLEDTIVLKDKTEVYYEMYRNARKKAKLAKSLALSSFMEARRIKNMYMLDDLEDSDDDDEMDLENLDNEGSDEDE
jgi:hypothetical protein